MFFQYSRLCTVLLMIAIIAMSGSQLIQGYENRGRPHAKVRMESLKSDYEEIVISYDDVHPPVVKQENKLKDDYGKYKSADSGNVIHVASPSTVGTAVHSKSTASPTTTQILLPEMSSIGERSTTPVNNVDRDRSASFSTDSSTRLSRSNSDATTATSRGPPRSDQDQESKEYNIDKSETTSVYRETSMTMDGSATPLYTLAEPKETATSERTESYYSQNSHTNNIGPRESTSSINPDKWTLESRNYQSTAATEEMLSAPPSTLEELHEPDKVTQESAPRTKWDESTLSLTDNQDMNQTEGDITSLASTMERDPHGGLMDNSEDLSLYDTVTESGYQDLNASTASNFTDGDLDRHVSTVEQSLQDTTVGVAGDLLQHAGTTTGYHEHLSSFTPPESIQNPLNESDQDAHFTKSTNVESEETKLIEELSTSSSHSEEITLSSRYIGGDNISFVSVEGTEVPVTLTEGIYTTEPSPASSQEDDTVPSYPSTITESDSPTNHLSYSQLNTISTENPVKLSAQRVEHNEDDTGPIHWRCPPRGELTNRSRNEHFVWYKLGNGIRSVTSVHGRVEAGMAWLTIETPGHVDEGRYVCVSRDASPFVSSEMYFYQFIILKTKWIDIGSSSTAAIFFNQKLVLNCPHGDIVTRNDLFLQCPSRITIVEGASNRSHSDYRCSDSVNQTTQLFFTHSYNNCSLSLLGCPSKTDNKSRNNYHRCSQQSNQSTIQPAKCQGNISIRFYYDSTRQKCLPYETDICGADYNSFASLSECEINCYLIQTDIQLCFHAQNPGEDQLCDSSQDASQDGAYKVTYNIDNNECVWFFHRHGCQISKNVFSSENKCVRACSHSRRLMTMEMKKVCMYDVPGAVSGQHGVLRWVFVPPINDCTQRTVSLTAEPFVMSFTTKKGCQVCRTESAEEICLSRPTNGECKKREIKWHLDARLGQCVRILDGGCGPSLNRFSTKHDCSETCSKFLISMTTTSTLTSTSSTHFPSTNNAWRTTRRKRFHRELSAFQANSVRTSTTFSTKASKELDVSKRMLDSDPCFGSAILGPCDQGPRMQNFTFVRYTYKPEQGQCHRVKYSGCRAGENLFDDANDCEEACTSRLQLRLRFKMCQGPPPRHCFNKSAGSSASKSFYFSPVELRCRPLISVDSEKCLSQVHGSLEECRQKCMSSEQQLRNKCYGKAVLDLVTCPPAQRLLLWFFMASLGQCLQYSTCKVSLHGNAFSSESECKHSCLAVSILTACSLPQDRGLGKQLLVRYYYETQRDKCLVFMYKGSMGNLNRFGSKEECEEVCQEVMVSEDSRPSALTKDSTALNSVLEAASSHLAEYNSETDGEYCFEGLASGECARVVPRARLTKFYYHLGQCLSFSFLGCGPTKRNHFESVLQCEQMCVARLSRTASSSCSGPGPSCPGSPSLSWSFIPKSGLCQLVSLCSNQSYPGSFSDQQSCSHACVPPLPKKSHLFDICHLPRSLPQNCSTPSTRWLYDRSSDTCLSTAGCASYGNNFPSLASCLRACSPRDLRDVCMLPEDRGPCTANTTSRYFFHWRSQQCRLFVYGGCLGNKNRFSSRSDCEAMCPALNRCNIRTRKTRCTKLIEDSPPMYMFNARENRCERLTETLCGNYFSFYSSKKQCDKDCVVTEDLRNIAYNSRKNMPRITHPRCSGVLKCNHYSSDRNAQNWLPRFYYDQNEGQCKFFYYNVCEGPEDRDNRYSSMHLCQSTCYHNHTTSLKWKSAQYTGSTPGTKEPKVKKGTCPEPHNKCSNLLSEAKICRTDTDCNFHLRCCQCETLGESIESHCMEPATCMLSRYGCCESSEMEATDLSHTNCTKTSAKCVSISESKVISQTHNAAYLECFVSGDPKPNITWTHLESKRAIDVETKWDLILPVWSGALQVNYTDSSLIGLWLCHAANEAGQDDLEITVDSRVNSSSATLQLYDEDNTNSTLRYVTLRSTVLLHCPIYGVPRPTIKWFFNDSLVLTDAEQHMTVHNRFVNIEDVALSVEGMWTCLGEQGESSVAFQITLRVQEPIQILPPPHGHLIKAAIGQKVVLYCNVVGDRKPKIAWSLRKGEVVSMVEAEERDSRKYIITKLSSDNQGDYLCTARNNVSEESLLLSVISAADDDILVNPAGFLFMGDKVTLHCPAKPKEKIFQVTWKKDDVQMEVRGLTLNFVLHSKLDSGFYTCQHGGRSYHTHLYVHV